MDRVIREEWEELGWKGLHWELNKMSIWAAITESHKLGS